jgi:hypothetical protein
MQKHHKRNMKHESLTSAERARPAELNAVAEQASRPARLEKMRADVERLFPGAELQRLRTEIERSFHVPQWGEHHNEGMLMDTHFEAILSALEGIRQGNMPEFFPASLREEFQQTVAANADALQRYVFLHDLSKADDLRMQTLPTDKDPKGMAWEGTLEEWYAEQQIPEDVRTNPVALAEWLKERKVKGLSYYHQGMELPEFGRKTETSQHGEDGAAKLTAMGYDGVSPAVLTAIANHEVAFQFTKVKPETYEKYFATMTQEERNLALVASYIDTMGSFGVDGKPDLSNFEALLISKMNAEKIATLKRDVTNIQGLDQKKVEAFFLALRKQESAIETSEKLLDRCKRECKTSSYNLDALKSNLAEVVSKGELEQGLADQVLELIQSGRVKEIGKIAGKKMQIINPVLKASEEK